MKKLALSVAIVLSAIGFVACSGSSESTPAPAASEKGPQEGLTNIRYYDLDSVSVHYELIKRLNAEAEAAMTAANARGRKLENELQSMANNIENKQRNNGYLSEQSFNADVQAFQTRQQQVQAEMARLQNNIAAQAAAQQQQLLDSIDNFLKAYCSVNKFDAVLVKTPGTYFADELNITDEVIKGLNERYKAPADSVKK